MTFGELANKVAAELPAGWQVVINISREISSVVLIDPDGENEIDLPIDGDIGGTVLEALEIACDDEASP